MRLQNVFDTAFLSASTIILFFFKAFAILLTAIFLVYTLVLLRQTITMGKTYETDKKRTFFIISMTQVVLAVFLLIFSLVVI